MSSAPTLRRIFARPETVLIAVIIVVSLLVSLQASAFLTRDNILNILLAMSTIAIIALGEAFVLMLGEIDLSVAAVIALAGASAAWLMADGLTPLLALPLGVIVGGSVGLVNGLVVVLFRVHSFIVTLGTLSIVQGLTLLVTGGLPISVPDSILPLGQKTLWGAQLPVLIMVGLTLGFQVVLTFTIFGRRVLFSGDNQEAARLAGIPVNQVRVAVFVLAGCLAGFAGIILTAQLGTASADSGGSLLLPIIAAAVVGGVSLLGGRGSIFGVFLGALLLAIVGNAFVILRLSNFWQQATYGAVVVVAGVVDQVRQRRSSAGPRRSRVGGSSSEDTPATGPSREVAAGMGPKP